MSGSGSSQDDAGLDNPAYAALSTVHAPFAQRRGRVLRYRSEIVAFLALPSPTTEVDWRNAAELVPPGTMVAMIETGCSLPDSWTVSRTLELVQMIGVDARGAEAPEAVALGPADVPAMLALVRLTNPGPFSDRSIELGDFFGIRRDGVLVAMAGERLRFPGWTEISAVCTAPAYRGSGMATRLVSALVAGIERRSERAFLHVLRSNAHAIRLYESLGFRVRRELILAVVAPT
jgi:ribosomal protein S18 acetylase RimI-like enzyme